MRVRGLRRCKECGEEWSYYDTGEVTCPTCGCVRSVGVEESGEIHTDAPVDLDLADPISDLDARPLREVAADVEEVARRYVTARGFVHAGDLQPIDDEVLAAAELRQVAARLRRSMDTPSDDVEAHFLALLEGAPAGERPGDVPDSMQAARGLATADVLDAFRRDVSRWLDDHPDESAEDVLETVRDRVKRVEALEGDVAPSEVDRLLAAARDLGTYLREDDETALVRARDRLSERGEA